VLQLDEVNLAALTMYSAVAYDYLADIDALLLTDDASGLDPANTRAQVVHTAPDVPQVDIWLLGDSPAELISDLDFAANSTIDYPAGAISIGIDVDNDATPDLTFDLPDLGGGTFVDLYAVNEAGGSPVFLLAHLPNGDTARINPTVCGDGEKQLSEVCDGADAGDLTCADFGFDGGTLGCSATCDEVVTTGCYMEYTQCYDGAAVALADGANQAQASVVPIVVTEVGTIVNVRVSVDASHTRVADLAARLRRNNNGATITNLFANILASGTADPCTGANMSVMLDSSAMQSVVTDACDVDADPAVSGTFAPSAMLNQWNNNNTSMAATWNLLIRDATANTEVGSLDNWCITFGYTN
jgi:subtilisin-like proprotein convertase family protein